MSGSNGIAKGKSSEPELIGVAHVAQSVEHFLGKEEVSGSSPDVGSTAG
jgi:hypothetical protein